MNEITNLQLFVVRNSEGKFFRAKGYHGSGDTWVDGIAKARIYAKLSGARSIVSFFANNYPDFDPPVIVKMSVSETEVLDETERIKKQQEKKRKQQEMREITQREWEFKRAKKELEDAKARYESLQKKKK